MGGNFRLDAIQAAVLRVKLKHLDGWTAGRQRNAATYRRLFADRDLDMIGLPTELPDRRHIYNQFVVRHQRPRRTDGYSQEAKDRFEIYYPVPLHRQECFADLGYRAGDLPPANRQLQKLWHLPIYAELTADMRQTVVATIANFYA